MAIEAKLAKNKYMLFMDKNMGLGASYDWKRVDRSTIFALNPNPQSEDADYIAYEAPITEITGYQPELPQEIACYEGNPIYDLVFNMFFNLPIGSEVKVPVLLCFAGTARKAWLISDTTVELGELNTVDGKLSFTLRFGGDIKRGTYTVSDGIPSFSANTAIEEISWNVTAPVKAATPQATHEAGTGYAAANIVWSPAATTFAAETVYTATITFRAADGYSFPENFGEEDITNFPAISGSSHPATARAVIRNGETSVTAIVEYVATAS